MKGRFLTILLALAIVAIAWPAFAQIQRGAIYGTVVDNSGAVLPGVSVTLSSNVKAPQTKVTGSAGEFRFGELDPGTYTLTASMQGFAPFKRENVIVGVGSNVQLPVQMALAGVKQQVTVTAATPVLDERLHGNITTFGDAVLNEVPTARDPWVLMQQVPGVQVDRVNVGGSESGQQSTFSARGDAGGQNTMWNLDGVTITDMAAIGSTPTYYDFNVFQEVQFTTAASDPRSQTGALGINMVTKRGTNDFHGLARVFFNNNNLESDNLPASLVGTRLVGNRVNQIADYGGDIGGPILKNRLWFWGSAAKNDIRENAITGAKDNTLLKTQAVKIDFQPISSNHFNFFWYRNDKEKFGRNSSVIRPPETAWNQGGPTNIYKFEDSHTFGQHFLLTGRYAHTSAGFFLTPVGGTAVNNVFNDAEGVWHNSYIDISTRRPQDQANANANYFRGMHEVKFGFSYRKTPVSTSSQWPGGHWVQLNADGTSNVWLTRADNFATTQNDVGGYVGDTIALNRLTLDIALRYDRQRGRNIASSAPANPLAPTVLPALTFNGQSPSFTWNSWSPRVGATFKINDKTNVRASYSFFQGQLPVSAITPINPVQLAGVEYAFADDGSHIPTTSNIDYSRVLSSYGIDPANPTALSSPNTIDPNLKAPRTHSFIVAIDREVLPNFAISTTFGYARLIDLIWQTYPGLTSADFVQTGTLGSLSMANGSPVPSNTPVFGLAPGVTLPAGSLLANRPGYHQRYWNWDVTATKRLSNHWMFRGYLTLSNDQEFYDNPSAAIQDPTARAISGAGSAGAGYTTDPEFTQYTWTFPNVNGGIVTYWPGTASGSLTDEYVMAKWTYSVMGLYEFPYGIHASGTVYGRQGYPSPAYGIVDRLGGLGSKTAVLVNPDLNATRLPNVNLVDLRAEKSFTYRGYSAVLSLDAFNAFNRNTVLQENRLITSANYLTPRQIIAPRIFRVGLRFQF